ncbi:hypothetical protein GFM09_31590 [Rhizobium leguminosarum bv. viciae]|uniref:hypothetical protein n=1 Tax=Rhizobium leguminosarum TaxID=384 RepID=UPI001441DA50|nr:hypothetical protein [Rhizobium leguminosarum]NKL73712.1 hypothetical protein [Rhizobium leguminosarum bv. viciae]
MNEGVCEAPTHKRLDGGAGCFGQADKIRKFCLSILSIKPFHSPVYFNNEIFERPADAGTTMQLYIRAVLAALIASPGSVSGEETTIRFGHPGIGLDNREY